MSKFTRKCVEDLLDDVESGNVVMISWCINDVLDATDNDLTEDEARSVLRMMCDRHDAEYGVSWSEVSYYTDEVISERNK